MKLCLIPARGGSQRIPRKNIKEFLGKPIIAYSIETALKSGLFDRVVVSTDDEEIANISINYGAEVPFIRPHNISDNFTGTVPVIRHGILECQKIFGNIDTVCCIYPTSPLLDVEYLKKAYTKLKADESLEFVFSATEFGYNIFRSFKINNDTVEMFWPENYSKRSQDLPLAFHDAGQFYFGKTDSFLNRDDMFSNVSSVVILPRYLVQDIDNLEDWYRAELLYKMFHNK